MSSAAAGPSGFVPKSRRPTVKERLARLQGMDETEEEVILFRKEVEAVAQKDIHVVGFRWHGTLQSLPGSQDLLHPVALRISHFLPLCPNHISPFPPFGPRCMSVWSSPTWTALLLFSSVFPHPPPFQNTFPGIALHGPTYHLCHRILRRSYFCMFSYMYYQFPFYSPRFSRCSVFSCVYLSSSLLYGCVPRPPMQLCPCMFSYTCF